MRLIAHMVEVSYSDEIETNIFPRIVYKTPFLKVKDITKLKEENYEDDTVIGEESTNGWVIKSHYSGNGITQPKGRYQIAFEPVLEEDEKIEDYRLEIKKTSRD